ncbi:hypothetical protein KQ302_13010 [Synechococcus sp. CS-602]|uniref:hypothetical protein n=1 Tax=unclassified Synechococcus TaxID=2626047 RepID=UPI0008FF6752|nr:MULTISPECIES: hypothetical protein [unclassified Synechococcus]MCT4364424.1 hypothetical protein [Candidatus Regnicoccus frigidus MAG-AL1]NQV10521.1 hypothetical protein [Cyanobacteria bacterium bin.51]APD48327.1 hypothetical protein BM449_08830 [Synechococcus sp. SynAce01]MCT0201502.1 hypothetical protein [Synechococcus sp. CS-603]MCT0206009.1 hypothetical protein [Synechococcus sp. CS-602]
MPAPTDRAYATITGNLASLLGISIASARRRVDQRAAKAEIRDIAGRVAMAEQMVEELSGSRQEQVRLLDSLLIAESDEANYLDED